MYNVPKHFFLREAIRSRSFRKESLKRGYCSDKKSDNVNETLQKTMLFNKMFWVSLWHLLLFMLPLEIFHHFFEFLLVFVIFTKKLIQNVHSIYV